MEIDLDKVPKKYEGLDGTELAISESQERMAVVVAKENADKFISLAEEENIETTIVAKVVEEPRVKMYWRGKLIVNLSREFLSTNGDVKKSNIKVLKPDYENSYFAKKAESNDIEKTWKETIQDLNCCSQRGLVERFDSTIGAGTVLMPYGGKYQLSPQEGMCSRIPTLKGYTDTGTIMTYGYNPEIALWSPFHGAVFAIVESITKYVAIGGDYKKAWLTLQEYFEKLRDDPSRWGKPFSALLGAYYVQEKLGIVSIGGKDSMSGSYNELDVPPTVVSFCVGTVDIKNVISTEFKNKNSKVLILRTKLDNDYLPDFDDLKENYEIIHKLINEKKVISVSTVRNGGIAETITKMCIGNKIGFKFEKDIDVCYPMYGTFIMELAKDVDIPKAEILGKTTDSQDIRIKNTVLDINELIELWEEPLEKVFPSKVDIQKEKCENISSNKKQIISRTIKIAKPRVFIPVFPGTNCEYDSTKAFQDAGAIVNVGIFKNIKTNDIQDSIDEFAKQIQDAQIIMIPGGFSAGDEPDGSGKFISAVFRNPRLKDLIHKHLYEKDGLMLGICNGFQALIKLGLLPYGDIMEMTDKMPTLTFNDISRHQSKMVRIKLVSKLSPWFSQIELGEEFIVPISHGEGKFVANDQALKELIENGQIATQYIDLEGNATYNIDYNPNGSVYAVEGITSKDGRILGKMGHSERCYTGITKNIPGNPDMKIFESGVKYFTY